MKSKKIRIGKEWSFEFRETKGLAEEFVSTLIPSGENSKIRLNLAKKYRDEYKYVCKAIVPQSLIMEFLGLCPMHNILVRYKMKGRDDVRRVYFPKASSGAWDSSRKTMIEANNLFWNEISINFASVEVADAFLPSSSISTCFIFFSDEELISVVENIKLMEMTGIYGDVKTIAEAFNEFLAMVIERDSTNAKTEQEFNQEGLS